jgi:hypothetical protein
VNRLRIAVAVAVVVVWAIIYLGSFFMHQTAPPELSGIMLAVVTWLFGTEVKKVVKRNGESKR